MYEFKILHKYTVIFIPEFLVDLYKGTTKTLKLI
jgi:hypothetical protein